MNDVGPRTGRPPGPHDDTLGKLLPAALRLFLEEGGASLTPTRLHSESGVARATIYRNWPEPADLIEVMLSRATEQPAGSVGDLELTDALHAATDLLLDRFDHKPVRPFFAACLEYGRHSERVAEAAERFIAGILDPFDTAIASASERGDLDLGAATVDEIVAELAGPLVFEHVLLGRRIDRGRAHRLVDDLVDRLANSPA